MDDLHSRFDLSEITTALAKSAGGRGDRRAILTDLLHSAMRITTAEMGNIQLLDQDGDLRIEVHHGLEQPFLDFFNRVHHGQAACGTALKLAKMVIIEDVKTSAHVYDERSMQTMLDAGARAVQSIPLKSSAGHVIGMMSMLYCQPRLPSDRDLQSLEVLAALATALIGDKSLFQTR